MKTAVIGAGITGLTSAYLLQKKGHFVSVFEKEDYLGGLASTVKAGKWNLEKFYHHIFRDDDYILELTKDLGLENIWFWRDSGAPIYWQEKVYPFSTALDLLKFSPLSFMSRLRTGLASLYLKYQNNFHHFEEKLAYQWLREKMGEETWQVIWKPLMKKKFGNYYKKIAMTWMWARVKKRSRFLGYPKGGFQIITDKLSQKIQNKGGKIYLNREITSLKELNSFDKIIFTGSNKLFLKIAPHLSNSFKKKLTEFQYLNTISLLLFLKKPLLKTSYWLNINDVNIPFVACVQQSNLVDSKFYNGFYPLYLTAYVDKNSPLYQKGEEQLLKDWSSCLQKINNDFNNNWVKKWFVFKKSFTQPLFLKQTFKFIPSIKTPLKNVFLANTSQIYPWDRGVNYSVQLAEKTINLITADS